MPNPPGWPPGLTPWGPWPPIGPPPPVPPVPPPNPLQTLGARLHFWTEAINTPTYRVLDGSRIENWIDQSQYQYDLTGVPGTLPDWNTSGGPNDLPYLSGALVSSTLNNVAIGLSGGRRLSIYAVLRHPGGGVTRSSPFFVLNDDNFAIAQRVFAVGQQPTNVYRSSATGNGEAQQSIDLGTTDNLWHVWTTRYLATGIVGELDGAPINPQFVGNTPAAPVESIRFGSGLSIPAHAYSGIIGEDVTPAEDLAIRNWIMFMTGLPS